MCVCVCVCVCVYVFVYVCVCVNPNTYNKRIMLRATTECQRPIRCHIFTGHFSQKSPIITGSFAENDLHVKACYGCWPSSPPTSVAKTAKTHSIAVYTLRPP